MPCPTSPPIALCIRAIRVRVPEFSPLQLRRDDGEIQLGGANVAHSAITVPMRLQPIQNVSPSPPLRERIRWNARTPIRILANAAALPMGGQITRWTWRPQAISFWDGKRCHQTLVGCAGNTERVACIIFNGGSSNPTCPTYADFGQFLEESASHRR
jgi:hypothetical protein